MKTILVFLLTLTIGLALPNPTWAHGGGGGAGGAGSGNGGGGGGNGGGGSSSSSAGSGGLGFGHATVGNPGHNASSTRSSHSQEASHRKYLDPFCSGWYPGYAGAYDSNYYYTPTPDQVTAAQKQVQTYVAAEHKGQRHPTKHRYIAVRTLNPTKAQLADYEKKLADAKSTAASGKSQLSNRWVAPDRLRCVMLFDTQSKQFAGSGCYVVGGTPPSGTVAKFDTYSAEFVGASSL
jgi:hypothetical protein